MSVYQKFIDSANEHKLKHKAQMHSTNMISTPSSRQSATMYSNQRHQLANLPPIRAINSTLASTPISKQQYKRLVEQQQQQKQQQQQQQQHQQERHSCNHHHHGANSNCRQQQFSATFHGDHSQNGQNVSQLDAFFKTDDPILLRWLQAMRFETQLECLTSLQARTLAIDEHSAGALSVRNSQVNIQEMRAESNFILDFIDYLIESLPLKFNTISKFSVEFSELWTRIMQQTAATTSSSNSCQVSSNNYRLGDGNLSAGKGSNLRQANSTVPATATTNLTIINCTPRKSAAAIRSQRPLDRLTVQIRNLCLEFNNQVYQYQEESSQSIDNGYLESALRKLKELYGKFVEIFIRFECANIVRALQYDFSQSSLNRLSSSSSLQPTRPFESSSAQLPLKWALIALWQLTKDDSYLCRTLIEKWNCAQIAEPKSAKRLDYSTKYDTENININERHGATTSSSSSSPEIIKSLRSDYLKLYEICQQANIGGERGQLTGVKQLPRSGALSDAMRSKQSFPQAGAAKQVSAIELLIEIIISQPNKHERLDMMNLIHSQEQSNKLIDLDELDQSVTAAIYTSNQYKVAALRILNHLCVNEQAVKTILKCFSTPPPNQGQSAPENKIIRSIFECYQTGQEHIYQNETMFHAINHSGPSMGANGQLRGRKRSRQTLKLEEVADTAEEYSDYGSRLTGSNSRNTCTNSAPGDNLSACEDEITGDDVVVKEAIRLLVQLTTLFHRSNRGIDFYTLIGRFSIESLVKYLTNIIKSTASREMLLLSLTALANISFITTEPMKMFGTNRYLLEMFRSSKSRSKDLELRDQAVTILANTADKNLLDIVENGGLTFLLSCLESCPLKMANSKQIMDRLKRDPLLTDEDGSNRLNIENKPRDRKPIDFSDDVPDVLECACDDELSQRNSQAASRLPQTIPVSHLSPNRQATVPISHCLARLQPAELAAMERIHQKTAVAFARMSADPSTTRMVLKYGGIKQMIDLCKFSHKRNHSDTVLIACLAALRKMARVIESETFRYYNALDLIELELNQAVEIYGNGSASRSPTIATNSNSNYVSQAHPNPNPMRLFASYV